MPLLSGDMPLRPRDFFRSRSVKLFWLLLISVVCLATAWWTLSSMHQDSPKPLAEVKALVEPPKVSSRILVTGGSGFIGSNLVDYLLSLNYKVVIFNRNGLKVEAHKTNPSIQYVAGDIRKKADIERLPTDIKWVVHLAAAISVSESMKDPKKYIQTNVEGSDNILRWAKAHGVQRFVAASSAAYYGNPATLPCVEDMDFAGISPYAKSKFDMEKLQENMFINHELCGAALRFFNVYGPRQDPKSPYSGVISKFLDQANDGKPITIFGDGNNTRDFVFVQDVARAIMSVLQDKPGFKVFNVGTGLATSILQLAESVKKVAKSSSEIKLLAPLKGDIIHSRSSAALLEKTTKWKPNMKLEQGLAITQEWFRKARSSAIVSK